MQHQRQRAARLSRDELAQWADEPIQLAHRQEHLIMELQKKAADLMIELELKDAPVFGQVGENHLAIARELRKRLP